MKSNFNDNNNSEEITLTKKNNILNKNKKERNSPFELLRIIVITLIVLHHIYINTQSLMKLTF